MIRQPQRMTHETVAMGNTMLLSLRPWERHRERITREEEGEQKQDEWSVQLSFTKFSSQPSRRRLGLLRPPRAARAHPDPARAAEQDGGSPAPPPRPRTTPAARRANRLPPANSRPSKSTVPPAPGRRPAPASGQTPRQSAPSHRPAILPQPLKQRRLATSRRAALAASDGRGLTSSQQRRDGRTACGVGLALRLASQLSSLYLLLT